MTVSVLSVAETPPNEALKIIQAQRDYYLSGKTRALSFRLEQIERFRKMLLDSEKAIFEALHQDLRKPDFESYVGELGIVLEETKDFLKHLKKWSRPRKAKVPMSLWPGWAKVYPEPYGLVLVLSPWNYPLQLSLSPALGAIGAGNCVLIKPSELAPATSALIARLIGENFPKQYLAVIEGGVPITTALLKEKFDYIFFTGSPNVGKVVMRAAAEHLTPLTLELGGKSPCIVDGSANLDVTARRLVWGKYFNTGQTCVAPDYALVQRDVLPKLMEKMKVALKQFYGDDPKRSPDYGRIITPQHFERLSKLLKDGTILIGGETDAKERYISPTMIGDANEDSSLMQDEIFGPILPIKAIDTLDEAIAYIREKPRPLALYFFTKDSGQARRVIDEVSFGSGCINDTLDQMVVKELPFGGIGDSGFGHYHGPYSFDTFTHWKGVLNKPYMMDLKVKYPPYSGHLGLAKKLIG